MPESAQIQSWLNGLRSRARLLLIVQTGAWVAGAAIGALMLGGVLDYALRAPVWLRTLGLLGAWITLALAIRRWVVPAIRFKPSLTEMALRVERGDSAKASGLRDGLASALDLSNQPDVAEELARPVVEAAEQSTRGIGLSEVLSGRQAVRAIAWGSAWVIALALVFGAAPGLFVTGASRMLLPWGGAEWPKRTTIVDVTGQRIHPLGTALAIRAALTRSDRAASAARVEVEYRVIENGRAGAWRTAALADQGRMVSVPKAVVADERQGALFERLIEPTGLKTERGVARGGEILLEYAIESGDDRTGMTRVRLVEAPSVVSAEGVVTAPAYAAKLGIGGGLRGEGRVSLDLGPGTDERAAPPALLAGSDVSVVIKLSKAVPGPGAGEGTDRVAWVSRSLGTDVARLVDDAQSGKAPMTIAADGDTWTISWRLAESVRMVVRPADEFGIVAGEDAAYRIDALRDNPPTASVITPAEDRSVLSTAVVELVGEARDDVGLEAVRLEKQLARRVEGSESATPEGAGAWEAVSAERSGAEVTKVLKTTSTLDLSTLTLKAGDEVWITAVAIDAYELDGQKHEAARSSVRKLKIISRDDLIEQVWGELSGVRRAAIRLDQEQSETQQMVQRAGAENSRRAARSQAQISERLSRLAQQMERVAKRVEENGLAEQSLSQVLRESRAGVERAGEQSATAGEKLAEASQREEQEGAQEAAGQTPRREAGDSQEQVREELARLADMLDRGEDTYASKRALERLLEQQRDLQRRTNEAGTQTAGKEAGELSEQQSQELNQIAQEQKAAGEQLAEAVQKMNQREQRLRKNDPAAAQAMARAAQRASRERVSERMKEAGEQVSKNQVGSAQQQQASAAQAMEQMLKDIEQTAANRDEVLRRHLASLIESIDGLIARQEANLTALDDRGVSDDLSGLDGAMVQLHQNTLGVLDQAAQGPREAEAIARSIEKAATAQSESVPHLRAKPGRSREARASEQESLDRLKEAKAAAEKADEDAADRQQERQRSELKEKYQAMLEKQVSLKEGAAELSAGEQTRRSRAAARQLGEEQMALRAELSALRDDVQELREAKVFDFAHQRLDGLMQEAGEALSGGEASELVVSRQTSSARVLKSLVDALAERKQDKKDFREGQQGGGGGGGGGGGKQPLLPPAREIALLRDLQVEAAEMTREVANERLSAAQREALVKSAGQLQKDLAVQGAELLKRITEKSGEPGDSRGEVEPMEEPRGASEPETGGAG